MSRTVAESDGLLDLLNTARKNLLDANAANEALRAALKASDRECHDALVAHHAAEAECEQLRRELAAARPGRPSPVYTLGQLVGVAIGAGLVGVVAGASVAAEIVGRLPW